MLEYWPKIRKFHTATPGASCPAILLLIHLGYCSYSNAPSVTPACHLKPKDGSQFHLDRKFDVHADSILLEYLETVKVDDPSYTPLEGFKILKHDRNNLEKLSIKTHYTESHALMKARVE